MQTGVDSNILSVASYHSPPIQTRTASHHARPARCSMAVRDSTTASKGGRLDGSRSQQAASSAEKSLGQARSSTGRSCSLHTCQAHRRGQDKKTRLTTVPTCPPPARYNCSVNASTKHTSDRLTPHAHMPAAHTPAAHTHLAGEFVLAEPFEGHVVGRQLPGDERPAVHVHLLRVGQALQHQRGGVVR